MRAAKYVQGMGVVVAIAGWCAWASAGCGSGGGAGSSEMKKVMTNIKAVTIIIVDTGSKIGEKKPDAKDVKPLQTNGAKLEVLTRQLFPMLTDAMCKQQGRNLAKGTGDLMKHSKAKNSEGIADAISQIRATCSACHNCAGL